MTSPGASAPSHPATGRPGGIDQNGSDDVLGQLARYIDDSPTPYHAVAQAAARLEAAGYRSLEGALRFPAEPGRFLVRRDGALVAWDSIALTDAGRRAVSDAGGGADHGVGVGFGVGFRVLGAHTDSPNLRIKPRPDLARAGWQQLAVEPYGGLLYNSWLDRDLGLAGRVALRDPGSPSGLRTELFHDRTPLLRVAQLAIHLDRAVNEGLVLNPQQHLTPIWGVGDEPAAFADYLAEQVSADPGAVLGWDVMTFVVEPPTRLGRRADMFAAPRLDNQASCAAGVRALIAASDAASDGASDGASPGPVPVLVLFDHEEVGSGSATGADSNLLLNVLERIVLAAGGDREDLHTALAASLIVSADMAHATHPNYADRHEPQHRIQPGAGPVIKINSNQRYASDGPGIAAIRLAGEQSGVPLQTFVTRSDLPCGSTIGPISAAATGIRAVDVGAPMLSMHSAREVAAVDDLRLYDALLAAALAPGPR